MMELFPYDAPRAIQKDFMDEVEKALKNGTHLIAHAPTGLGKTVGALAPALEYAIENNMTIFFLTSRHTQHKIAIDTLKDIQKKHDTPILATDIIGKRWMCPVAGAQLLSGGEFTEFCKKSREEGSCEYFNNTKRGTQLTVEAKETYDHIKVLSPMGCDKLIETCKERKLCPYEMACSLANEANVVVADYFYIFSPTIRDPFLNKTNKALDSSIIIVDEGHNLSSRMMDLLTSQLSSFIIKRAIQEAKKHDQHPCIELLSSLQDVLLRLAKGMKEERLVTMDTFIKEIETFKEYDEMISELAFVGDAIREKQKSSFIASIASFLERWHDPTQGYVRLLKARNAPTGTILTLYHKCLDPAIYTKETIKSSHSTILMSGTLTPTTMHKDLIGFPKETACKEYGSPFPKKNKLNIVIPKTTTKFSARSAGQYQNIAKICSEVVNAVPGNSAIFFPSYKLRDDIFHFFSPMCKKTIFTEKAKLTKTEKEEMLERFKQYKDSGAVLLGVASGSFGEGIDLPGDYLKSVVVVGLPLGTPNLETKELIAYYDKKFGKGWDYGYTFPALNKVLQNAGRCIRSETDRGIVVFLDARYAWNSYFKCFPPDYDIKIMQDYMPSIQAFFRR